MAASQGWKLSTNGNGRALPEEGSEDGELWFIGVAVVAAVFAVAYVLGLAVWLAGQLASLLSGNGWPAASPNDALGILAGVYEHPGDPGRAWPSGGDELGPGWLVYLILCAALSPMVYAGVLVVRLGLNYRRRREFRRFRLGFASGREIRRTLSASVVVRKAKSVRPSLAGKRNIDPLQVGYYLGTDIRSRQRLYASVEDVFIILAPPRQGKDVHFCTPFTIDAPGPCIVTSTRSDAFTNTYAMRARTGTVHVFDPNGMTNWPERLRWSPVNGCEAALVAENRATSIVTGSGVSLTGNGAFFASGAIRIVRCYLHAAAVGGKSMRDVVTWSTQASNPEPVRLLRQGEAEGTAVPGWAAELEALIATDPRIKAGFWANVTQGLACFSDPGVLDACSPGAAEEFDIDEFLSGRNTLYILGKDQKNGSVAPVVTAMMEDLFEKARKRAAHMPGSRLDPPLTIELNEAAHIAPMPNLPAYMGDSGGFSIALHVYLQSLSQARARWGEHEAMIMWDNAAVRVIMGGAGNVDDLDDISRLMGETWEDQRTKSYGPDDVERGSSTRKFRRRVLSAEEIRTLKFGTAVMVARSARPVEAKLLPWWKRRDAKLIGAGKAATEKQIAGHISTP